MSKYIRRTLPRFVPPCSIEIMADFSSDKISCVDVVAVAELLLLLLAILAGLLWEEDHPLVVLALLIVNEHAFLSIRHLKTKRFENIILQALILIIFHGCLDTLITESIFSLT